MGTTRSIAEVLRFLDLAHEVRQQFRAHLRKGVDLTLEQVTILCQIDLAGGRVSGSQLATALHRANHTITRRVDGLGKLGLVHRHRDASGDARVVFIALTPGGRRTLARARDHLDPLADRLPKTQIQCYMKRRLNLAKCSYMRAVRTVVDLPD